MKEQKGLFALIFIACLLLITGFYFSWSLESKMEELGGMASPGKLSVSIKDKSDANSLYGFTEADIYKLEKSLASAAIGYSSRQYLAVGYGRQTAESCVIGINSRYRSLSGIPIKSGSFFSDTDDTERNPVAVIDEELAWQLFNNEAVVGCFIDIAGRKFKIVGIARHDTSVIGKLSGKGRLQIYVPYGALLELKPETKIDHFLIDMGTAGTTGGNMEAVGNALTAMGKSPDHYVRVDYDIQHAVSSQKSKIVLFLMGLMIILALLKYTAAKLKGLIQTIRHACKFDYFTSVLRQYRIDLLGTLFTTLLAAGGIAVIWRLIRFNVYISPEFIPDDISDFTYYPKLLQKMIDQSALLAGYTAPYDEMLRNTAGVLLNWIFYLGMFLGFLLFYIAMAGMRKEPVPLPTAVLLCGVFLLACMALDLLLSGILGLAPVMDIQAISIIWGFLLTNLLIFSRVKEGRRYTDIGT